MSIFNNQITVTKTTNEADLRSEKQVKKDRTFNGYNEIPSYLDMLSKGHQKVYIFDPYIETNSLEIINDIICQDQYNSLFKSAILICCRKPKNKKEIDEIKKCIDKKNVLEKITIYRLSDKDFFHDRFIVFKNQNNCECFMLGNSISSFKSSKHINIVNQTDINIFNQLKNIYTQHKNKVYPEVKENVK